MSLANWRDLSIVFLALPAFILGLVPAVLLYFLIRGMEWVLRQLRSVAVPIQAQFRKVADLTERASQGITAPIIATKSSAEQVRRWLSFLSTSKSIGEEV